MVTRFKELTSPAALAVSVADAKTALRVVDTQSIATRANRAVGSGDSQLLVIAKMAGSVGNQYATRVVVSGLNTALSVTFASNLLTINLATDGAGAATSSVNDVIAAIYANAEAAAVFDATAGVGDGTGVMAAAASDNLTAGVDSGDEDAYITFLIQATTEVIEQYTGRAIIQRQFAAYFDRWCDPMDLPVSPVDSLEGIYYRDVDGVEQEFTDDMHLDASDDLLPARLGLNFDSIFPLTELGRLSPIRVEFVAGFGTTSASVPARIRQCILFLTAHWYASREPVVNGTAVLSNKVPFTFETALNSFRVLSV